IPRRIVASTAPRSASRVGPDRHAIKAQRSPVASSTSGYWIEIGSPQLRHRPRSTTQESTGTLSYQATPAPQRGQRDGGRTTDCLGSAPQRRMHTLRKLPNTAPTTPASRISSGRAPASSAGTLHLVEKDPRRDGDIERLRPGRERNPHPPARAGCD